MQYKPCCELCCNVTGTDFFTSTVTEENFKINYRVLIVIMNA